MILPGHRRAEPRYAELHGAPLGRALAPLWQPWPECYLDLPWRATLGRPVPLLAAWADAHRFPLRLRRLELTLADPRGRLETRAWDLDLRLEERVGGAVLAELELDRPGLWQAWADLRAERLPGPCGAPGQTLCFRNHLAPGLPEEPLQVRMDAVPPPRLPGMAAGDPHVHSSATRDLVEFGPPPDLLRRAAAAVDLDWFALTDHSYDLDDAVDNWNRRDEALPVWQAQRRWLADAAGRSGPFALGGEECSVGGLGGGTLHLLLLGTDRFWPGSADGGERPWPRRPEWRLPALLEALRDTGTLPVSAHTGERPGAGEHWLLRRRAWTTADMTLLPAHQILSGGLGADFAAGRRRWRELLAAGEPAAGGRAAVLAGGDSHGHFSLSRRVAVPGWSLACDRTQLFGRYRSAVILPGTDLHAPPPPGTADPRASRLLDELGAGRVLLGDGPLLWFAGEDDRPVLGGALAGSRPRLHARAHRDAGPWTWVRLFGGGSGGESLLAEWRRPGDESCWPLPASWAGHSWLRAEARQRDGFAMTNAVRPT